MESHIILLIPALMACLFFSGGLCLFYGSGYTFSESAAHALMTMLMLLSFFFQIGIITGFIWIYPAGCILMAGLCIYFIIKFKTRVAPCFNNAASFIKKFPAPAILISCFWVILCILSIYTHPPWPDLLASGILNSKTSFMPINHAFADSPLYPVKYCTAIWGFMAYMSLGFSTYALARRYAWPPMSITVTLIVISMPRLVIISVRPGSEIIPAASALLAFLCMQRAIEYPNITDFLMIIISLAFSIEKNPMGIAFPSVLFLLSLVLLLRRHGKKIWAELLKQNILAVLCFLPFFVIFSQIWLFIHNYIVSDNFLAGAPKNFFNQDGIMGALANLVRYIFQSFHLTRPFDSLINWMLGFSPEQAVMKIYTIIFNPLFGNMGASSDFFISHANDAIFPWFGPFGFFLVLPAIIYGVIRGQRRIKAIAITLMGYFYIISLAVSWNPCNVRFLTPFFVCGGFLIAFLLPPWRITRVGRGFLQAAAVLLIFYGILINLNLLQAVMQ